MKKIGQYPELMGYYLTASLNLQQVQQVQLNKFVKRLKFYTLIRRKSPSFEKSLNYFSIYENHSIH